MANICWRGLAPLEYHQIIGISDFLVSVKTRGCYIWPVKLIFKISKIRLNADEYLHVLECNVISTLLCGPARVYQCYLKMELQRTEGKEFHSKFKYLNLFDIVIEFDFSVCELVWFSVSCIPFIPTPAA